MTAQPLLIPLGVRCQGCNQDVPFLGQWHPWSKAYICSVCSTRYPMPDVYDNTRPAVKQEIEYDAGRSMNVAMENALFRLRKGCILTLDEAMSREGLPCDPMKPQRTLYIFDCRKCRRDAAYETEIKRRGALHRLNRLSTQPTPEQRAGWRHFNISLPFCKRCGNAHNEKFHDGSDYKEFCESCQDKYTVESYYNHRGIFGGDDVEAILDRIQNANPGLFERGVLPDYWFTLMLKEEA